MRRVTAAQKGFTLIELLIVIAIIGIIVSMLIPNLLDAMQKAKQKRTIADVRITGTAMFSWLTDQVGAAAAGQANTSVDLASYGPPRPVAALESLLTPAYLQVVPPLDGWKFPYEYYLKTGTLVHERQIMLIRSQGRDRTFEGDEYTVTSFDSTDYNQDIVWADGFMVRWPSPKGG
ncbi:MAG TPA: prepilin-type N-terminal cleavage/methylation domain-containing protein [Thermoanaerobaculia bacterium]|nr:prepilin-type N-terminal cleavage/methylation domain-containing protein [Thermoanaerobaculia bacterium]